MNIVKAANLACPIDGNRLAMHEKQLLCENGHAFDVARQGYVNLLPVQHKRSRQPGDSKEMVAARSDFLNSGIYEPIASKLADIVFEQIRWEHETSLMDAGCGEGYYLDKVFKSLTDKPYDQTLSFIGLDISKPAIIESTKRNKQISWVVGTNRQPPVEDASVDIVICVFGFQSFEGFHKIMKAGARLILVEPGQDHLQELRKIIYKEVKKTAPSDLIHAEKTGFSIVETQMLQFKTEISTKQQIHNLLLMTPHFFRANKEGKEVAESLQELKLTVDIVYRVLEKN